MSEQEPVFEMLWDCKYCGQKKLLGLTHRFCAGCGGPQDPASRYFPSDAEKVAVHAHPYVGADVACPACRQPMGRAATCCTNCGSPIDKGAEVVRRDDVVVPPPGMAPTVPAMGMGVAPAPAAPKKGIPGWVFGLVGGILFLVVGVILVTLLWKREGTFVVTGHAWERRIAIERFEATRKSVWCDEIPTGAREVSRRKEQRGTRKEKDGETCATRKKDMGNGTFKEVKECTPKMKDVPVQSDKCEVELTEWRPGRSLSEKGVSLAEAPRWPKVALASTGTCIGCEREGAKTETYTLKLADPKGAEVTCDLPEAKWRGFAKGSKWAGKARVLTSGVDCDGLVRK